jgi:hypothetical protein
MTNADIEAEILDLFPDTPGAWPAVYRPVVGDAVETFAALKDCRRATGGRVRGKYATLRLPMRDVPTPEIGDVIVINGTRWEYCQNQDVLDENKEDWPFWLLHCRDKDAMGLTGGRA